MKEIGAQTGKRDWETSRVSPGSQRRLCFIGGKERIWAAYRLRGRRL